MTITKGRYVSRLGVSILGATLLLGAGSTAFGQGGYYGNDHPHGQNGNHQKREKKAEKRHQKNEKEALKQHQRHEREMYGNDRELRDHQRQEREAVKHHQRHEKNDRKDHQRQERDGRYNNDGRYNDGRYNDGRYGNDGYYDRDGRSNDGYYDDGYGNGSDVRRVALERGYQEGIRAGRDDRSRNRGAHYEDHSGFRNATAGYNNRYGNIDAYRRSFRDGFRQGYEEGYNGRYSNGSGRSNGIGNILGEIFGRP